MKGAFFQNMPLSEIKASLEERFRKIYPHHIINGETVFSLPDGSDMTIVILSTFRSLVMDYHSETDWDDGDQFFIEDYDSPDELFAAMLTETQQ